MIALTLTNRAVMDWVGQLPSSTEVQATHVLRWPGRRFNQPQLDLIPILAAKRGYKWIMFSARECHFAYVTPYEAALHLKRVKVHRGEDKARSSLTGEADSD